MSRTELDVQTSEDDVAEMVERFTLRIIIPPEEYDKGVVLGSINVTTVEIRDDDGECFAVAAMFV